MHADEKLTAFMELESAIRSVEGDRGRSLDASSTFTFDAAEAHPTHEYADKIVSLRVKLLIAKGADINARSGKDRHGLTALEQARFMRNIEVVRVLEEAGAR